MASNGKWVNPNPRVDDHQTNLALQSLSSYLGGWQSDELRTPIVQTSGGNETRGNATVVSQYRVQGGMCEWYGHYTIGNTTAWPAGTMSLVLPVAAEATTFIASGATSMPGTSVRAYNGNFAYGFVEYSLTLAGLFSPAYSATTYRAVAWTVAAVPIAWVTTNVLSWNLRYRVT